MEVKEEKQTYYTNTWLCKRHAPAPSLIIHASIPLKTIQVGFVSEVFVSPFPALPNNPYGKDKNRI
jgi:hypothetical protein